MAAFLVAFPGWSIDDYLGLTVAEYEALVDANNEAHKST